MQLPKNTNMSASLDLPADWELIESAENGTFVVKPIKIFTFGDRKFKIDTSAKVRPAKGFIPAHAYSTDESSEGYEIECHMDRSFQLHNLWFRSGDYMHRVIPAEIDVKLPAANYIDVIDIGSFIMEQPIGSVQLILDIDTAPRSYDDLDIEHVEHIYCNGVYVADCVDPTDKLNNLWVNYKNYYHKLKFHCHMPTDKAVATEPVTTMLSFAVVKTIYVTDVIGMLEYMAQNEASYFEAIVSIECSEFIVQLLNPNITEKHIPIITRLMAYFKDDLDYERMINIFIYYNELPQLANQLREFNTLIHNVVGEVHSTIMQLYYATIIKHNLFYIKFWENKENKQFVNLCISENLFIKYNAIETFKEMMNSFENVKAKYYMQMVFASMEDGVSPEYAKILKTKIKHEITEQKIIDYRYTYAIKVDKSIDIETFADEVINFFV